MRPKLGMIKGSGLNCTHRNSSKNSASLFFIKVFLVHNFGRKICYEQKINYFMPKLEYLGIELVPIHLDLMATLRVGKHG